ncbi:GH15453 [Drosophila grimshawi]|uniref:GH15453 n=1 Tax=Drosophila grimshawi TaxID=7222 RepID=B4J2D8_DROGR|nr:GH15453 [Drosophila grimshawi]
MTKKNAERRTASAPGGGNKKEDTSSAKDSRSATATPNNSLESQHFKEVVNFAKPNRTSTATHVSAVR